MLNKIPDEITWYYYLDVKSSRNCLLASKTFNSTIKSFYGSFFQYFIYLIKNTSRRIYLQHNFLSNKHYSINFNLIEKSICIDVHPGTFILYKFELSNYFHFKIVSPYYNSIIWIPVDFNEIRQNIINQSFKCSLNYHSSKYDSQLCLYHQTSLSDFYYTDWYLDSLKLKIKCPHDIDYFLYYINLIKKIYLYLVSIYLLTFKAIRFIFS